MTFTVFAAGAHAAQGVPVAAALSTSPQPASRSFPLDALVPPALRHGGPEGLRRAQLICMATLIMSAAGAFFGWQSYRAAGHLSIQATILLLGTPVALLNLVWQWLLRRTDVPGVLLCGETLVVLGSMGFFGAGAQDSSQVWLVLLPVLGAFLLGPGVGFALALVVLGLEGWFFALAEQGHVFASPGPNGSYFSFLAVGTSSLGLAGLAAMFERSRRLATQAQQDGLRAAEEANARLEALAADVARQRDSAQEAAAQRGALLARMAESTRQQESGVAEARLSLRALTDGARTVADGVFNLDAAADLAAESVGASGKAAQEVQGSVARLVELVEGAAVALDAAGQRVRQVEHEVGGVARAVDNAAGAMRSVEEGARAVQERASNASELGRVVLEEARRSAEVVRGTLQGLQQLAAGNASAAARVRSLAGQVQRIGGTLEVIDDITRQVRMLSLNAAIIAMQAGEHGRSFGVVAEQMRELADRTSERTRETVGIIESLTVQATTTQAAMAEDEARALQGRSLGAEAEETLSMVARSLEAVGAELEHIADESRRQASAARTGVQEVNALTAGARRAAEGAALEAREVERVGKTGTDMRAMVPRVQEAVGAQGRASREATAAVERIHAVVRRIQQAQEVQSRATDGVSATVEHLGAAQQQQVKNIRALNRDPR